MASIAQALDALLPTQTHPPRLTSLSNSLLAQSRLRAPNLKPEEEIARPFACAEIACTRLRGPLRLPANLKGRPPCKPAVYKKLFGFLDGVLTDQKKASAPPASSTPKKRQLNGALKPAPSPATTPASKSKSETAFTGKVQAENRNQSTTEAPEWVMPLIRKLCKAFSTPAMPPHVYTGVCVVLKLATLWPQNAGEEVADEFKQTVTSLVIAMYLLVLTRMQKGDMTTDVYTRSCGKSTEVAELGDSVRGKEMVEGWIKRLDQEEWCSGQDWWESVPEGVMEPQNDTAVNGQSPGVADVDPVAKRRLKGRKAQEVLEEDDDDPEGVLLPGLGTMMQDCVDWLSEERKLEYIAWKENVLSTIKRIERDGAKTVAVR